MPESPSLPEVFDVLVIGAGPTGMACAIEAQRAGFRSVLVDKGCLCNSLFHYPAHMTFFTTSELLEIGDIPFPSPNAKPTRNEALEYYRKVAMHYKLDIRPYERVEAVSGEDLNFTIRTRDAFDREHRYATRKVVVATGYYDLPNMMNIPGEDLPKVMHYYNDPHPYYGLDVARHRRQKLRRHRRPRALASRRTRHRGLSRLRHAASHQVLDSPRHRKPH